jgi:hypothetical protein
MNATLAFRVLGSADGRRDLVSYAKAVARYADADPIVHPEIPAFLSSFTYPAAMRHHVETTGSTKSYVGPVGVPAIRWDIDIDDDPDAALNAARHLAGHLAERYGQDGLSVFFSGSKGYHVETATGNAVEPTLDANQIARKVAEMVASTVAVPIDLGVYDRLRLWRAPNSKHPRTGLFKVRIEPEDLLHASTECVCQRAVEPIPFDPPALASPAPQFLDDWRRAELAVRDRSNERRERRGQVGSGGARINALTRRLITNPEEIQVGERHRLLFSAANLAEFDRIEDLIVDLLTVPGLDTALPPREVDRQIACGIGHARRQRSEGSAC